MHAQAAYLLLTSSSQTQMCSRQERSERRVAHYLTSKSWVNLGCMCPSESTSVSVKHDAFVVYAHSRTSEDKEHNIEYSANFFGPM